MKKLMGAVDMKKLVAVSALAMVLLPALAFAQIAAPTVPVAGQGVNLTNVRDVITRIATFLITISLVIAVIFIVYGGIRYMTAGSNEESTKAAKSIIWNGIIGALVVLAIGVIMQTLANVVNWNTFVP